MLDVLFLTKCRNSRPLSLKTGKGRSFYFSQDRLSKFSHLKDDHLTRRNRLQVIDEHLAMFKAPGGDSRREIRDFAPSFVRTRRTVAAPFHSFFACWRINVQRLLWMASRKLLWSTTLFQALFAQLFTPSLLFIHSLIVETVVRGSPTKFATWKISSIASRSVENITLLSLAILKYTKITNISSSMSQSQGAGCVKVLKPDKNCRTTRF